MDLINHLKWRYATKKYDTSKKVSSEDISKIKEAINLAPTSYGLQLFKVLDIQDKAIRERLKPASWNQSQITDASHLFVFCSYTDAGGTEVNAYMQRKAEVQGLDLKDLKGYGDFVKGALASRAKEEKQIWMSKQTYIALSNAMTACAALKIDSTPMEGFDPNAYGEILGLDTKELKASVVLAIGYRSSEDATQHSAKVRKKEEHLFETV